MVKTLRPMGNSYGIVIDRPIMDLLGIGPDTPLEITTHDGGLLIRPVREVDDRKTRVRQAAKRMAAVHHDALKELAE